MLNVILLANLIFKFVMSGSAMQWIDLCWHGLWNFVYFHFSHQFLNHLDRFSIQTPSTPWSAFAVGTVFLSKTLYINWIHLFVTRKFFSSLHCQSFSSSVHLIDVLFLCQSCREVQYALVYFQSSLSHLYSFVHKLCIQWKQYFSDPQNLPNWHFQDNLFYVLPLSAYQPISDTRFPLRLSSYTLAQVFHKQIFGCPCRWKIV